MPPFEQKVLEGFSLISAQAREVLIEEVTIARQEAINELEATPEDAKEPILSSIQAANFMIEHLEESQREFQECSS
jgi:hypothetical protein